MRAIKVKMVNKLLSELVRVNEVISELVNEVISALVMEVMD